MNCKILCYIFMEGNVWPVQEAMILYLLKFSLHTIYSSTWSPENIYLEKERSSHSWKHCWKFFFIYISLLTVSVAVLWMLWMAPKWYSGWFMSRGLRSWCSGMSKTSTQKTHHGRMQKPVVGNIWKSKIELFVVPFQEILYKCLVNSLICGTNFLCTTPVTIETGGHWFGLFLLPLDAESLWYVIVDCGILFWGFGQLF